jgi:hypothetical protein
MQVVHTRSTSRSGRILSNTSDEKNNDPAHFRAFGNAESRLHAERPGSDILSSARHPLLHAVAHTTSTRMTLMLIYAAARHGLFCSMTGMLGAS